MESNGILTNFIGGEWRAASGKQVADIINPATAETIAKVPLSPAADVDAAARAALAAYPEWRRTPAGERVQVLFKAKVQGGEKGNFLAPTIPADVAPGSETAQTEIFGPVLSLMKAKDMDEAIRFINAGRYGNMACLFTTSGHAARRFRYEVEAGNIGINVGVAAPMAYFPFSGWKESFFGDLHAQGWDAIEFYTQKKVVVEQWKGWSRKF